MKPVTFIRHSRGSKQPGQIELPDCVAAKAHDLQAAGLSFDIEVLSTGEVSLTVVGKNAEGDDDDLDIEVTANGMGLIAAAATRLIERAHRRFLQQAEPA